MKITDIETKARRRGMSVKDVLAKAGISRTTFWRWKKGIYQPRMATVDRLEAILTPRLKK